MSGIEISGGRIVITNGARTVATTSGTLLQFLTDEQTFSTSVAFPDANKTQLYQWQYRVTRAPGDNFAVIREAITAVGALPQEWSSGPTIAAVPAGADIFIGRIILSRTVSPSHTWLGQPLSPIVPTGVEIPVVGGTSILVEMGPGISRAMTIDIEGGNLVTRLEHSVGPPAGNFGSNGVVPYALPPNSTSDNFRRGAINTSVAGPAALPIYVLPGAIAQQATYTSAMDAGSNAGGQGFVNRAQLGGTDQVPYFDPTNYGSTYSLTIQGRFGRRS